MNAHAILRLTLAAVLAVAATACGGDGAGSPSGSGPRSPDAPPADRSGLDEEQAERFREARAEQEAALESTRDLVGSAASADIETLESGLLTLNSALVRARAEIGRLRGEKPNGHKALMIELRSANRQIQAAYDKLLAHHPEPTPERLGLGGD